MDSLEPDLKEVLWAFLDEIEQYRKLSTTKTDFSELKAIVKEQGENLRELVHAVKELAETRKRTEKVLAELGRGLTARLGKNSNVA